MEALRAQVDELAKMLRPAVEAEKDASKLERFDKGLDRAFVQGLQAA